MTTRQRLDKIILSVTGEDIRLLGNWDALPCSASDRPLIADALSIPEFLLARCRDLTDIMALMESEHEDTPSQEGPSLF